MRATAILILIAIGLVGSLNNRFYALLFYWWFAIFRPQDLIWLDISAWRPSLVAGIVFVIPCFLTCTWPRLSHPLSIATLLWLMLATIATVINGCQELGWYWLDFMARLILVLFLTDRLLDSAAKVFWLVFTVAVSLGFLSAKAGFVALVKGGAVQYGFDNLTGSFTGSNGFALGTAMLVFFLLASAQNVRTPRAEPHNEPQLQPSVRSLPAWLVFARIGLIAAVPLSIFNIMSLFSRGALLGLTSGALVFILLQRRAVGVLALALLMVLLAAAVLPIPEGYKERVSSIFASEENRDDSASGRFYFWQLAVNMVKDHNLGIGVGCYPAYYATYDETAGWHGEARSVHSSHFQILAETGYVGITIWAFLFFYAFKTLFRVRARSRDDRLTPEFRYFLFTYSNALMASMTVFLVGGTFIELARNEITWLTFILAAVLDRLSMATLPAGDNGAGKTSMARSGDGVTTHAMTGNSTRPT